MSLYLWLIISLPSLPTISNWAAISSLVQAVPSAKVNASIRKSLPTYCMFKFQLVMVTVPPSDKVIIMSAVLAFTIILSGVIPVPKTSLSSPPESVII